MTPETAYHMGFRTAASGFFFDGMEMIAACSTRMPGGIDGLRGGLELLFRDRDAVNEHMAWVAQLVSAAFRHPTTPPTGVDDYRQLMQAGVFEIVNRWSYIQDIKQVTRLQAWFYAGFGLGRAQTVTKGVELYDRLRDIVPAGTQLADMPDNLRRMAAECAKQMDVAAQEDDLRSVRPLFEDSARRMHRVAIQLQGEHSAIVYASDNADDAVALVESARKIALDLAPTGI